MFVCTPFFGGCHGIQSALEPAGREAEAIARLFWWMTGGAVMVWIAVVSLGIYALRTRSLSARRSSFMIIGGGAIVPTFVLAGLLAYGLWMLPRLVASAPEGSLRIHVSGERWWWRVRYESRQGEPVHLANEIRMPVGEPVEFILESSNVIHSFWIPSLGGKRDMIPGRVTRLTLTPTRTGVFRGVCAEYCGASHALMSFYVTVSEKEEFTQWLEQQATPALSPTSEPARSGQTHFLANGCGACHAIRGTTAAGLIGPDLTHVGSRLSLSAGVLTNEGNAFEQWITHPDRIKPGVLMPAFRMLPQADREAIAVYLEGLK
jgi:cytochrome c oxidase subunit II